MDKNKIIAILDELADKNEDYIFEKYLEIKDEIFKNNEDITDDVYDKVRDTLILLILMDLIMMM